MEHIQEQDLAKIRELLRHTGEFIAYFELAESKMIEWRHDIEQRAQSQQQQAQQQLQSLHNELDALQEILTQAGLARFRLTAEQTLQQGEEHLLLLQKSSELFIENLATQQLEFHKMVEKSLLQIEQQHEQARDRLSIELAQYDVQHFRRIASESCSQVERAASNAVAKSESLLRSFQWRSISLALITTLITAFAIGLYVSNELPWEIHQHAMNERAAGRALLKAWPALSQEEKAKIMYTHGRQKG